MNINNVNNDGLVDFDGYNFYYSAITSDEGKLYKKSADFRYTEKLSDTINTLYITVKGRFVYYVSENKIYKLNLNTKEDEVIFTHNDKSEWISNMAVIDNNMFFSTDDENSKQYVMDLETFTIEELYSDAYGFVIRDDIIYYSGNENYGVYSFDLSSKKSIKLTDDSADHLIIQNNILYYHADTNFYELDINHNPHIKTKVILNSTKDIYVCSYNILSNNLICSNMNLFKINLETGETSIILDMIADKINIIRDEIWFRAYEDDGFKLYKTDINGDNLVMIK